MVSSMPMRIFTVTGRSPALRTAARTIGAEQPPLPRQGRSAALAGDLGHRAAEVEVDVVGRVLVARPSRAAAPTHLRVDAVQLDRRGASHPGRRRHIRSVSALRSTSAREVTISLTYSPAPYSRHSRRKPRLVTPAIGASTTGTSASTAPPRSAPGRRQQRRGGRCATQPSPRRRRSRCAPGPSSRARAR